MSPQRAVDILLVEDNPRDAELTLRAFRKAHLGETVFHVKDGQEALDWLFGMGVFQDQNRRENPKVILLDLKLRKVDGLEVLRALRANNKTCSIPVVVLSSSQEHHDLEECYALGANSYIVKPVDFDNLSATVAQAGTYWLQVNKSPA